MGRLFLSSGFHLNNAAWNSNPFLANKICSWSRFAEKTKLFGISKKLEIKVMHSLLLSTMPFLNSNPFLEKKTLQNQNTWNFKKFETICSFQLTLSVSPGVTVTDLFLCFFFNGDIRPSSWSWLAFICCNCQTNKPYFMICLSHFWSVICWSYNL